MDFLEKMRALPRGFSLAAFWFWYGDLSPERMREQIRMMTEQGVWNGFMHARAYLKTPYWGDGWYEFSATVKATGKLLKHRRKHPGRFWLSACYPPKPR